MCFPFKKTPFQFLYAWSWTWNRSSEAKFPPFYTPCLRVCIENVQIKIRDWSFLFTNHIALYVFLWYLLIGTLHSFTQLRIRIWYGNLVLFKSQFYSMKCFGRIISQLSTRSLPFRSCWDKRIISWWLLSLLLLL